jgi:hypothetical protein
MYAFDVGVGSDDWTLHRYDSLNTAYSPEGITSWQYVEADCTTEDNITTCIVTNFYDHDVTDVILKIPFRGYWYNQSWSLLKSDSDNYTIESISSLSSMTFFITESPHPMVQIIKPEKAVYIANKKFFPFFIPLLIGKIDIEVEIRLYPPAEIDRVEFYIDDDLKEVNIAEPYRWTWDERVFFRHTIKVVAYFSSGENALDDITVWKFF